MGKIVEVVLHRIQRDDFNGDDEAVMVVGGLWGFTSHTADSPPVDRRDIFNFPQGPVSFEPGKTVDVNMDARFSVGTPIQDPTEGIPPWLRFGGELFVKLPAVPGGQYSLGQEFTKALHTNDLINEQPFKRRVRFRMGDSVEFRCDFTYRYVHYF
ncbi:hypothetical protein [Streptomyces sp. NRRL S-118]|uniref:hypothetical protein n=1 Tax=Streptomyces sp. NRRL S-118 TaxID=1463881 RepID=UPI0004C52E8E|nr:hypothetical protein [Streptomyces sp. NRRL S-118]